MIFNGSPSLADRKAVNEWRKNETLDTWNAYTGYYNTAYHLRCLPEKLKPVLEKMNEQIFSPFLRAEDVEHERKVITQEAWGCFQNEKLLAYTREFIQKIFPGHSLSRVTNALGWPETIATLSIEDIRMWHKTRYHSGNMNIIIVGNINEDSLQTLKEVMSAVPRGTRYIREYEKTPLPETNEIIKTADEIGLVKEQVEINISLHKDIPDTPQDHEHVFKRILQDILHEKLRDEKALCYSVHVSSRRGTHYVNFSIDIKTSEEHRELVLRTINEHTHLLIQSDTYKTRFEQIRTISLERLRANEHDSEDIAHSATSEVVRTNNIKKLIENIHNREKMTFENMQKIGTYLTDPVYTVAEIILPSKK
jgi:predicted Zn-dependent peptidase